jgi:endogenous inhibitor of DNA gyrase (YacG/DUF329 family)
VSVQASRTVDCPACGRRTVFGPANPWRPFCSERCKRIDFGAWASDRYVVAGSRLEHSVDSDDATDPQTERDSPVRDDR